MTRSCDKVKFLGEDQPCTSHADCPGLACDHSPFGNHSNTCRRSQYSICLQYSDCANRLECGSSFLCNCVSKVLTFLFTNHLRKN